MDLPAQNPNLNFQNSSGTYFVAKPTPPVEPPKKNLKGLLFLEVGLAEILGILLILALFFEALNFFNILSLSSIYPKQLGWLPHLAQKNTTTKNANTVVQNTPAPTGLPSPTPPFVTFIEKPNYLPDAKLWRARGILYKYDGNQIQVKVGDQILKLIFSSQTSMFYKQTVTQTNSATPSSNIQNVPYTLYDLDNPENLGKNVEVYYNPDNTGANIIQTINLQG